MEAPELLRVWVLAGEWEPCHPPPERGHGQARGTPRGEGMGGTPREGCGWGLPVGRDSGGGENVAVT